MAELKTARLPPLAFPFSFPAEKLYLLDFTRASQSRARARRPSRVLQLRRLALGSLR